MNSFLWHVGPESPSSRAGDCTSGSFHWVADEEGREGTGVCGESGQRGRWSIPRGWGWGADKRGKPSWWGDGVLLQGLLDF